MGLAVETRIRADLDAVWAHTQDPARHPRWDFRFTRIDHLPRAEGEPQRFRYATCVLPFVTISGTGVSATEPQGPDGSRTSALRFASPHPLSLLAEGSGYWHHIPDGDGVRLVTGYDYRTRWGAFGALTDRVLFRPLTVWATAWSFDRLRLWLERGVTPERALFNWLAEIAVRACVVGCAVTGLGLDSLLRLFGPFAASLAYLCPLLLSLAVCVALFKAPLAATPAARRCLRRPRTGMRAPRVLRVLENPR